MKVQLKWTCFVLLLFVNSDLFSQLNQFDENGILIVRLQSDQNKIDYLRGQITNENKQAIEQRIAEVRQERRQHNQMMIAYFDLNYNYSKIIYMYDTASVHLKNGKTKDILLDMNLEPISDFTLNNYSFLVLSENTNSSSARGLVLLNPDLSRVNHNRLDFVKLNTFFLASKERLFELAIKKFDKRMKKFLPIE